MYEMQKLAEKLSNIIKGSEKQRNKNLSQIDDILCNV